MECLTFTELAIVWGLCVAILTLLVTTTLKEIRKHLKLDEDVPLGKPFKDLKTAEKMALIIIVICLIIMAFTFFWFVFCKLLETNPKDNKKPFPTPVQTQQPVPSPIETPPISKKLPTVEIDGTEFSLYAFGRDYFWDFGTFDVKFVEKIKTSDEMISYLKQIHGDIKTYDAIICIGTASFSGGNLVEEDRAKNRATIITDWMRIVFGEFERSPELYKLNLGHYLESPDSDDQRLIIIVGVKRLKSDAPIIKKILAPENEKILKQKLKEKNFPFNFEAYSLFEIQEAS